MNILKSPDGPLRELALFAGAGGGILGGHLLGWQTVCAVEIEPYPASVLLARQNDGFLPPFPVWDDIRTFDGKPWRGLVDVVSGGFPCQDISAAGKGAGIDGTRSGLWSEMFRVVCEVRPRFVFVENSPALTSRGLGRVLGNLASIGYDAQWGVLGADDVGAPHIRKRIWIPCMDRSAYSIGQKAKRRIPEREQTAESTRICRNVADSYSLREQQQAQENVNERLSERKGKKKSEPGIVCEDVRNTSKPRLQDSGGKEVERSEKIKELERPGCHATNANMSGCQKQRERIAGGKEHATIECRCWWKTEPDVGRVVDELPARVDRIKALGNAQVPAVAKSAWEILMEDL